MNQIHIIDWLVDRVGNERRTVMVVSSSLMDASRKGAAWSGEGRLILRLVKLFGKRPVLSISTAKSWKMGDRDNDHRVRQIPKRQTTSLIHEWMMERITKDIPCLRRLERTGTTVSKILCSSDECLGYLIHNAAYSKAVFNRITSTS